MPYHPDQHHRQSIRLPAYDYRWPGVYYVTICVKDRHCLFGQVVDGVMRLNAYGHIAEEEWLRTAALRSYVIMPNHLHGIIAIVDANGHDLGDMNAGRDMTRHVPTTVPTAVPTTVPDESMRAFSKPVARSVSSIIGSFKASVTKRINRRWHTPGGSIWQPRFYEHIVRDAQDLDRIRRYIAENPACWHDDRYHPAR
jgi:REP element-mobilizing transposase RayT